MRARSLRANPALGSVHRLPVRICDGQQQWRHELHRVRWGLLRERRHRVAVPAVRQGHVVPQRASRVRPLRGRQIRERVGFEHLQRVRGGHSDIGCWIHGVCTLPTRRAPELDRPGELPRLPRRHLFRTGEASGARPARWARTPRRGLRPAPSPKRASSSTPSSPTRRCSAPKTRSATEGGACPDR